MDHMRLMVNSHHTSWQLIARREKIHVMFFMNSTHFLRMVTVDQNCNLLAMAFASIASGIVSQEGSGI